LVRIRLGDKRTKLQLVLRWKPKPLVYVRSEPVTVERPTRAQAQCRLKFGELSEASKHYTYEEVAELVGGEVVEINGGKAIKLPDGRILMKHHAFIKARLSGWRSPHTRVRIPRWLRELSSRYWVSIPAFILKKYKAARK